VNIGNQTVSTDSDGRFQLLVPAADDASISSGLRAIKFESIANEAREELVGTATDVAAVASANGGEIVIEASRRINPEPICLTYSNTGAEVLWFRYTNRFGETLQVPQVGLNSLSSPSGQPYPISDFLSTEESQPDGFYGFEWGVDFFTWLNAGTNQEMVSASWQLLGKEVSIEQPKTEVPLCPSPGEIAGCAEFSERMLSRLFEQALSTVSRLSRECDRAKKRGIWAPSGTFRNPYLRQAASSLRAIREKLNALPANRYICDNVAPAGCQLRSYPRAQILADFDRILAVKLPKGLRHITKRYPTERRAFLAELNRQPATFYACSR
jgi:hypothetical protein